MPMDEYWTGRDGMDYYDSHFYDSDCNEVEDDYDDDYELEPDFELDSWRGFEV